MLLEIKKMKPCIRPEALLQNWVLKMKISDVEYQGDGAKAIFYYTAEDRVDFRQLIRDLAESFSIKIEMKQIGARQEAARLGGIGSCGRELCCSTWLTDFRSVSTASARYQQLSLNPQKLAGQCGKLKCCLNFELDAYIEALKAFPKADTKLFTKKGKAFHVKTDVFRGLMWYIYDSESEGGPGFVPLKTDRVHEIIAMNKAGNQPMDLKDFMVEIEPEKEPDYTNVVGQDSLNRFEHVFKRKKKKRSKKSGQKKAATNNNNQQQKSQNNKNRPQGQGQQNKKNKQNNKPKQGQQKQGQGQKGQQNYKPKQGKKPQTKQAITKPNQKVITTLNGSKVTDQKENQIIMKKRISVALASLLTCVGVISCTNELLIYENNQGFENNTWVYDDPKTFSFDIKDSSVFINLFINLRITTDYPYSNIYMFLHSDYPNGYTDIDTLEFFLADKDGYWLGDNSGTVVENSALISRGNFPVSGTYTFKLEQAMRNDSLPEVLDVGIRIEEVEE